MNAETKAYIELTAEVTVRRLIDELCKRLPCEKQEETLNKIERQMVQVETAEVNHYNEINEIQKKSQEAIDTTREIQKSVNGLWWKVFTAVVVPLAVFMFVQRWL
jgi:hypothetical protein